MKKQSKPEAVDEKPEPRSPTGFSQSEGRKTAVDLTDDPYPSADEQYDDLEISFADSKKGVEDGLDDLFFGVPPKSHDELWSEIRHDYKWSFDLTKEDEIKRRREMIEDNYQELNPEIAAQRKAELKRREVLKTADKNSPEYRKAIGEDRQARIAAMRARYQKEEKTDAVPPTELPKEEKKSKHNCSLINRLFVRKNQNG